MFSETDATRPHTTTRSHPAWGSIVGLLGELLMVTGVVLGLYVVWQLFYTDIEANATQQEIVEGLDWVAPIEEESDGGVTIIPDNLKLDPDSAIAMDEPGLAETFATMYVPRWGYDYVKPISQGVTRTDVIGRAHV